MQITDFFERIIPPAGSAEEGTEQRADGTPSRAKAVLGRGETPEQRRRLLADAALRRLQGSAEAVEADAKPSFSAGHSESRTAPGKQEISSNTTALLSSSRSSSGIRDHSQRNGTEDKAGVSAEPDCVIIDKEGPSTKIQESSVAGGVGSTPSIGEWVDLVEADESDAAAGNAQQQKTVVCPCCGTRWAALAISNAELNAHVDACLAGQIV